MARKGRRGVKLSAADVIDIRKSTGSISQVDLSRKYGVSKALICLIVNRKIWKEVA
jgi:predicted transcriptional regulator